MTDVAKDLQVTLQDHRWQAVVQRDATQDGVFVYSVASTGIYCRPSCPSRRAKREHVRFHDNASAAEQAGFRPCLRCRPNAVSHISDAVAKVEKACRSLESVDQPLSLQALAVEAGMSPSHFHRVFKRMTGVTPGGYATALRHQRSRVGLMSSKSVTEAIYDAGYNSSGRFYEASNEMLGMTPTAFRNGGKSIELMFAVGVCSLGAILVARSDKGIAAILLGDDAERLVRDLQDQFPNATLMGGDATFEETVAKVVGLVETPAQAFDLALDVRGTAFQHRVWQALRDIPPGSTVSYSELAERLGMPKAVRAVANACARNVIAVAIPCHRVVRRNGDLSGYRWGVARKDALLAKEKKS